MAESALAAFERRHTDELRRIAERGRRWRAVVLGSGMVLLVAGAAVWLF